MITVTLTDSGIPYGEVYNHFDTVSAWAKEHCPSYSHYEDIDLSDFSLVHDVVADYFFTDEKDATLFRLKWE